VSSVTYIVTGCMKWIGIRLEWTGEGLEAACSRVVLRVCRFMETWMLVWSLICLVLTAFTCATFVVDTDRFRSLCLSVCPCLIVSLMSASSSSLSSSVFQHAYTVCSKKVHTRGLL